MSGFDQRWRQLWASRGPLRGFRIWQNDRVVLEEIQHGEGEVAPVLPDVSQASAATVCWREGPPPVPIPVGAV